MKKPHPSGGQPVKTVGRDSPPFIANRSGRATPFEPRLDDETGLAMVAMGDTLFNLRSGPFDFSCATCHAASGQRIRSAGAAPTSPDPEEAKVVVGDVAGLSRVPRRT